MKASFSQTDGMDVIDNSIVGIDRRLFVDKLDANPKNQQREIRRAVILF